MSKCNISSNLNASHSARPEGSNVAGRRAGRWNQAAGSGGSAHLILGEVLQVGLHSLRAAQGRVGLTGLQWASTPVRCIGE